LARTQRAASSPGGIAPRKIKSTWAAGPPRASRAQMARQAEV